MAKDVKKKVIIKVTDDGSLKKTKKEIDGLNKATGRASKGSMEYNRNMKGLSKQSSNASKNFSKQAQGMQGVLVPAYAEIAARVFALSAAFNALSRAANFSLLIKGQAEYAKMTGKDMGEVAKQVQKASKYMLDFKEASTSVALATTAGLSTNQITDMTKAAVDSSTALGRSMTDTMDRLTRGIVKAEPEILDEIGVIIRLDKVYKDYAESVDKSTTALTESEKLIARNTAIMGQLEDKFGGIADKLPPNYFQQLASTVMDLINVMSSRLVDVIGPVLKFLSESKTLIVVLMAVIARSLIGKIFPAFKTFGNKMANLPKKMDKSISRIEDRMKKTHGIMTTAEKKSAASQILAPGARGKAWMTNPMGSGSATIREANKQMKKWGEVRTGGLKGISPAELKQTNKAWGDLTTKIKLGNKALSGTVRAVHAVQRAYLGVKKAGADMVGKGVQQWRAVGRAIQMHGVFRGTIMGINRIGREWRKAGQEATWYERAAKRAGVAGMAFATGLKAISAAMGKLMGLFIGITMFLSIGKAIVSMFHDFDTKFARAATSAKEMSTSLDKVRDTIRLRDKDLLNFEGITTNLSQTIKNAEFAKNISESIYNATHEALKRINVDMQDMGFWDTMIDMVKSAFGKGIADSIKKDMFMLADVAASMGSEMESKVRSILLQQEGVTGEAIQIYTKGVIDDLNADLKLDEGTKRYKEAAELEKIMQDRVFELTGTRILNEAVAPSVGYLASQVAEEDRVTVMGLIEDIVKEFNEAATLAAQSLKDFGDGLTKYSKDLKGILDSVVKKTPWHELAKSQNSLITQWDSGNISPAGLMQKVDAAGLFKTSYDDGGPIDKALKAFKGKDGATEENSSALMRALIGNTGDSGGTGYQGLMAIMGGTDAVANNLLWAQSAERVAGFQQKLNDLKKIGGSTLQAQAVEQRNILNEELLLKQKLYDINKEEGRYNKGKDLEGLEDSTKREINLIKAKLEATKNLNVELLKYDSSIKGEIILLEDLYQAKLDDTGQDKEGKKYKLQELANTDDITKKANEYINSLDKTIKAKQELINWTYMYKRATDVEKAAIDAAQASALKYSSFLGITDPEARKEILGNATLKGIGETHQKAITSAGIMGTDRQFKKQVKYLDLYFKVEKLRKENIENQVAHDAGMKALYDTELLNAREDLIDARWKERTQELATMMQTIANSFGEGVTKVFSDWFSHKGWDNNTLWTSLGQGMTSGASRSIGNMAQKQVFGNKGIAGAATAAFFGQDMADTLFPKTELELAQQRTDWLKQIATEGIPIADKDKDFSKLDVTKPSFWTNFFGDAGSKSEGLSNVVGTAQKWGGNILDAILRFGMANGGVAPGGFRAFANGGIANRPTLGMVGEGRFNEAVVPLPDGRSIPIKGAAGNVTVNVAIDSNGQAKAESSTGEGAKELGYLISQAVQSELVDQQRPGGLLSSY